MKIGILTFHRAENFGAVLQCYALQTYLESLGHNVSILDYRCNAIEQTYYLFNLKSLFYRRNFLASAINYFTRLYQWKDRLQKKKGYANFRRKYLHLTNPIYKIDKDLGFDVYITGSDQVWNTSLLHGFNKIYYLDFPISKQAKKISYAVSSEESALKKLKEYRNELIASLNTFDYISVRENEFANALKEYTSQKIHICVDPTFFLPKEYYLKLAIQPKETDYILVYHMAEIPEGSKLAENLAKKSSSNIIEIHARFANRKDTTKHRQNIGPQELLGYIVYSNLIITSSFHGLALSLILKKNFYIISKPNNLRLRNILKKIGLENRIISSIDNIVFNDINYDTVSKQINDLTTESKSYLLKALQ